jgi:outer membrane protein assembly factor BamB
MMRMVAALFAFCLAVPMVAAGDWPQFRGPGGTGVADDQKPPVKFGPKQNLAWKVPVPPGASSPIVVGDKIIFTAFDDGKLFTICYSTVDGKELWKADAKAKSIEPFQHIHGSPAASTPVSDGKRVVTYFGSCGLICYDLDGKEQWRFDLPMAVTNHEFGTGTSPLIADGLVLLARDLSKDSAVYAINLADGSQKWKTDRKAPTSYSTPVVWNDGDKKVLVVPGALSLTGYDVQGGKALWALDKLSAVACTTPVVYKDMLVHSSWAPGGADFKLPAFEDILKAAGDEKLGYITKAGAAKTPFRDFFDNNDPNKDGKITREEWDGLIKTLAAGQNRAIALKPGGKQELAWSYTKNLPYVPSPLVYRDRYYILKDGPLMTCLDAKTGKPVFEAERVAKAGPMSYASPVAANGHIYLSALDGTMAVIEAGEDAPEVVHSVKLAEPVRATPAIAHDTLYVRSDKFLYAFRAGK